MNEFEFEMEGLEELESDLTEAIKKAPVQAERTLLKLGREFKKNAKARAEAELNSHPRKDGDGKSIAEKWGHRKVDDSVGMAVLVWNSARHFHLVEDGHKLVKNGQTIGFVPGRHIMEKTRNEYKDIIPKQFEKMIDDILKERDLN